MSDDQFKCDECGGVYDKGWTDEEAQKEAEHNFGTETIKKEELAIICDDCYNALMKRMRHLRN